MATRAPTRVDSTGERDQVLLKIQNGVLVVGNANDPPRQQRSAQS